ncbi:MAG: MFS transporter [Thermoproteota archaeon]|jgi:Sugar phosphate permease
MQTAGEIVTSKERIKVAFAAQFGSIIDWYDFFLVGLVAALVWSKTLFPTTVSPSLTIFFVLLTYSIAYISRPVGAIIFGHYGDKIGRKTMMIFTLVLCGGSMFAMAAIPTYAQIGLLAPILVLLLRLIFGLGVGGEIGGAQTWVSEFASYSKHRGFWNSVVISSLGIGSFLAAILIYLFLIVFGTDNFISYAWRYLFIIGGIAIVIGILIRYVTLESPIFIKAKKSGRIVKIPLAVAFKREWKNILPFLTLVIPGLLAYALIGAGPLVISYASALKISFLSIVLAQAIGALLSVPFCLIGGILADKIGRKAVFIIGMAILTVITYPSFLLLFSKTFELLLLQQILTNSWLFFYGAFMALMAETFSTEIRYTALGVTYQLSTLIGGLMISFLVPYIIAISGGLLNAWTNISIMLIVVYVISGIIVGLFTKETKNVIME